MENPQAAEQEPQQVKAQKQVQGAQNISLQPKFLWGLKGDVKQNIFYYDDQTVIYPCGHNVVIYNMDDKSQKYISGIEGSEGITAMALSPAKKSLAVCERSDRAICCVYDVNTLKRKKILTSSECQAKEFVSVNFAPSNEKSMLVTLTSEPYQVIIWTWDKAKCFTFQPISGVNGNMSVTQVSFHNQDQNIILITGNSVYKYYRVQDNNSLKPIHSQILKKDSHISNNYTCHTWLPDGRLLVCTDKGEIMLLENSGDFKMSLNEAPGDDFYIECIVTYQKGFIIAGDNGQIMIYEKSEDPKNPYNKIAKLPQNEKGDQKGEYPELNAGIMSSRIRHMALASSEDWIIFSTENNQLMKVFANPERPQDDSKYEYLVCPFHSRAVQGMDICIKKNLITTCSTDKSVRIWNNSNPPTLEICEQYPDEAYSVAFHPSGFHLIVGFTDRVRMMNVFQKTLKSFHTIPIKGCREIRFSNGGHLFACASQSNINVYKFYTGENTQDMIYKAHLGPVRCLQWLDDDSGFISGGWDGNVFRWNLYTDKEDTKDMNPKFGFTIKNFQFSSVANKPDNKAIVYAAGIDRTIRTIDQGKLELTYDAGANISQIQLLKGGRAIFAGIADADRPGSIQIINLQWQKIFEIQAHALPVERLRVSQDNQFLFSSGSDGVFAIFNILDKDPHKKDKEYSSVSQQDEILIEKQELDKFKQDIEHLKNRIEIAKQNKEAAVLQEQDRKNKKISELNQEIENKDIENSNRYEQLLEAKKEMERFNQDKIKQMCQSHELEMERRRQDYRDKQEADTQRFNELQAQKDEESRKFEERLNELSLHHEKIIKELKQDQQIQLDRQVQDTNRLKENIEKMMNDHKKQRENIEEDTWNKIDILKDKNKEDLAKIIDQGMQSKCKLTLINNNFRKTKAEREGKEKEIEMKDEEINHLDKETRNLKQQIESQKGELKERDTTIKDKDHRIVDLKKKTQELEKFKFVLDYKIKELKRDIGPRELDIQKLNEQTNKMRQELRHFDRVNQNLALIVDDLRMRQEGLTNEVKNLRIKLDEQQSFKKKFKDDVFDCLHHITDFKKLKAGVIRLHKKYVKEEVKNEAGDTDLHREYASRRRYLENNVNYLRQMLQKDQEVHKKDHNKIMSENVILLQEINDQRKEVKALQIKIRQNEKRIEDLQKGGGFDGDALMEEIQRQDMTIQDLLKQINEYEAQNNEIMGNQYAMNDQQMQYQQQYDPMEGQMPMEDMGQPQMDDLGGMHPDGGMDMEGMVPEQVQEAPQMEAPPIEEAQPPVEPAQQQESPQAEPQPDAAGGEQPPADMEGDKPPE